MNIDDPRVAPYRDIRERDLVRRDASHFVVTSKFGPVGLFDERGNLLATADDGDHMAVAVSPDETLLADGDRERSATAQDHLCCYRLDVGRRCQQRQGGQHFEPIPLPHIATAECQGM